MVLDNSSRLKDSESFNKVILSLDLSKEDREDCKKLLADKFKEVNKKGGSKKCRKNHRTTWGLPCHCL